MSPLSRVRQGLELAAGTAVVIAVVVGVGTVLDRRRSETNAAEERWCHAHARYARTSRDSLDVAIRCGTLTLLHPDSIETERLERLRLFMQKGPNALERPKTTCDLLREYVRVPSDSADAESRCGPFRSSGSQ